MNQIPVVTIDGPSGVGKGTLSLALAKKLKWHLLDSGAIYRVLAVAARKNNVDLNDEKSLSLLASKLDIEFITDELGVHVLLDSESVTDAIRQQKSADAASKIAVYHDVRESLLMRQRAFLKLPGLIADGRDMGTVVFPNAPVKIFLDASAAERAKRRVQQLQSKEIYVRFEDVLLEIKARDERDRNRKVAPLIAAENALLLDSTHLSIEQVIEKALDYINSKICM